MIQLEKPVLTGSMPVVWPTILDLGRDECKRILRKLGKIILEHDRLDINTLGALLFLCVN